MRNRDCLADIAMGVFILIVCVCVAVVVATYP